MFIERPPKIYRLLFPGAVWRLPDSHKKVAYITFDDGPVPEVTPEVLSILDRHEVKATFFVVADNVRRYPRLFDEIRRRGHSFGNHTMHHIQGVKVSADDYFEDVRLASDIVPSSLFRPPHGLMRLSQLNGIKKNFTVVMHDVVTRDYNSRISPGKVLDNVRRYVRPGSIIVFHDSLKSMKNVLAALEPSIVWLKQNGYELRPIPMSI